MSCKSYVVEYNIADHPMTNEPDWCKDQVFDDADDAIQYIQDDCNHSWIPHRIRITWDD